MDYSEVRRLMLWTFVGFLLLTAAIAIVSVLSGEFGELQAKILGSCLVISAASICSMACAAYIERRNNRHLGLAGIALSAVWAILTIIGIWAEIQDEGYWKSVLTLAVGAAALAHGFLLLLPELGGRHRWVQFVAVASIGILAAQIVTAVWAEIHDEVYYRLLTVMAIIVVLETLLVPILMKFGGQPRLRAEKLILQKMGENLYQDASGKKFRLAAIGDDGEPRANL